MSEGLPHGLTQIDGDRIDPATEQQQVTGNNLLTAIAGLTPSGYDYVAVTYPNTTTEVFTFKTGGSGGTTVATVTVVYTDATKVNLSTVTKT